MKIIALKGEKDSGNSKDLRDVINFAGKKIGIVTQGDYYKEEENSVKKHLVWFKDNKCDIVICAWRGMTPTSKHWNIEREIGEILKNYTNPIYLFLQNKSEAEISDNELTKKANPKKAEEIVEFLKKLILHA